MWVDKRDQWFVLHEMLGIENLCRFPKFADCSGFEMVLAEAHRFAQAEFVPTIVPGDTLGCRYHPETASVRLPDGFRKAYDLFRQGGWLTMCDSPAVGGDGFPMAVGTAVAEIFYACGFNIFGAAELSHAAAKVLELYGTSAQKALYMTRLYSGEWAGTMCLTEPDAGSDVGAIQTTAFPNENGTYRLSGTKIFISAGEHDLTQNIIHMVLARVAGDPPGTRGLSLFIVPKYLPQEDGTVGRRNDVLCTGIERKMGLHGFPTCTLAFGDKGACTGFLLGERGKGIVEMFHMMNEQRLLVGVQGLSYISAAFLHAVDYARRRKQGASVSGLGSASGGQVAIVGHPDIQRMLLTLKAFTEGGRALAYYVGWCIDHAAAADGRERERWQGLVALLTPVLKAYLTDVAWKATGMAIQCAGGNGYCADYPFERLARDCKVTAIYEGANGIQAIDLLFRKLLGDKGDHFGELLRCIDQTLQAADAIAALASCANSVRQAKGRLEAVVAYLRTLAHTEETPSLYAKAAPFLEAMGDVILGWLHLWQLSIAIPRLQALGAETRSPEAACRTKEGAFYYGKAAGARFFIETLLRRTDGKFAELMSDAHPVTAMPETAFAG
jgi:hypothetical protein